MAPCGGCRAARRRSGTTGSPASAKRRSTRAIASLDYSGARTTYKVDVTRISEPPNVQAHRRAVRRAGDEERRRRAVERRDTARATIGAATFAVDYGRPLARGRELLGDVLPYDYVWRTGANAATQFTTSAPITLAGIACRPARTRSGRFRDRSGADLIVNKQSGQWGTEYDGAQDLGMAHMLTETVEHAGREVHDFDRRARTRGTGRSRWSGDRSGGRRRSSWARPVTSEAGDCLLHQRSDRRRRR